MNARGYQPGETMMSPYHKIATTALDNFASIDRPDQDKQLTLDSLAQEVFTDFRQHTPLMLEQSTTVNAAIDMMHRSHVKQKLVIDANESFRGVITLADLKSVKVAQASEATGLKREDLTVAHVMTGRSRLQAIDVKSLRTAKIGDVLATLESLGDQHVLVVDRDTESVRGIISATDIARALHDPVKINTRAKSFAEIVDAIRA